MTKPGTPNASGYARSKTCTMRGVTQRLTALGVGAGWRYLEAGGVARWLATRVGRDGQVAATDLDPRFAFDEAQTHSEGPPPAL